MLCFPYFWKYWAFSGLIQFNFYNPLPSSNFLFYLFIYLFIFKKVRGQNLALIRNASVCFGFLLFQLFGNFSLFEEQSVNILISDKTL